MQFKTMSVIYEILLTYYWSTINLMVSCVSCVGKLSFVNLQSPLYKAMLVLKLNDLNCKKKYTISVI